MDRKQAESKLIELNSQLQELYEEESYINQQIAELEEFLSAYEY